MRNDFDFRLKMDVVNRINFIVYFVFILLYNVKLRKFIFRNFRYHLRL